MGETLASSYCYQIYKHEIFLTFYHGVISLFILSNYLCLFIYLMLGLEKLFILIPSTFTQVII
jgi:hypothetical protein